LFRTQHQEDRFVDAFDRIADALQRLAAHQDSPPARPIVTFDDIRRLFFAGDKIGAIKRFRELTGAGLKDAKDCVEAIRQF